MTSKLKDSRSCKPEESDSEEEVPFKGDDEITRFLNTRKVIRNSKNLCEIEWYVSEAERKKADTLLFLEQVPKLRRLSELVFKPNLLVEQEVQTEISWISDMKLVEGQISDFEKIVENSEKICKIQSKNHEIVNQSLECEKCKEALLNNKLNLSIEKDKKLLDNSKRKDKKSTKKREFQNNLKNLKKGKVIVSKKEEKEEKGKEKNDYFYSEKIIKSEKSEKQNSENYNENNEEGFVKENFGIEELWKNENNLSKENENIFRIETEQMDDDKNENKLCYLNENIEDFESSIVKQDNHEKESNKYSSILLENSKKENNEEEFEKLIENDRSLPNITSKNMYAHSEFKDFSENNFERFDHQNEESYIESPKLKPKYENLDNNEKNKVILQKIEIEKKEPEEVHKEKRVSNRKSKLTQLKEILSLKNHRIYQKKDTNVSFSPLKTENTLEFSQFSEFSENKFIDPSKNSLQKGEKNEKGESLNKNSLISVEKSQKKMCRLPTIHKETHIEKNICYEFEEKSLGNLKKEENELRNYKSSENLLKNKKTEEKLEKKSNKIKFDKDSFLKKFSVQNANDLSKNDGILFGKICWLQKNEKENSEEIQLCIETLEKMHGKFCGKNCQHLVRFYHSLGKGYAHANRVAIPLATRKIGFFS